MAVSQKCFSVSWKNVSWFPEIVSWFPEYEAWFPKIHEKLYYYDKKYIYLPLQKWWKRLHMKEYASD